MMRLFSLLISFASLSLISCITVIEHDNALIDQCKELFAPAYLTRSTLHSSYSEEYMIISDINQVNSESMVLIGELPSGTHLNIESIRSYEDFSWPYYLRVIVKVTSGSFEGITADIPVCAPFHPRDKWIMECTLDPDDLQFDSGILRKCLI